MKKHLLTFLFLSLVVGLHSNVFAIEREDKLTQQTYFGVIVRDMGNDTCMVCNMTGDPSFMKTFPGGSPAPRLIINVDTLYDFEIFGGNVYFCGVKNNYGVLGYFPLAGFPANAVQYLNVPTSYRLRRLEVGTMAGQTHLVAIGDGSRGSAEIVDAIDFGAYWGMHFFDATDTTVILTDLAITDNYVVISFYNMCELPNTPNVNVLFLVKPTIYGTTFSPLNFHWEIAIKDAFISTIIEACEGDAFVVASISCVNLIGTCGINVSAFIGMTHYAHILITEQTTAEVRIKDLRYNKTQKGTELLLDYREDVFQHRSIVYHLESTMITGSHTADGHWFDGVLLTSLYPNSALPNHFYAAGINRFDVCNMDLFRYHYNMWGTCTEYVSCTTTESEKYNKKDNLSFNRVDIDQVPVGKHESEKYINIENKCKSTK